MALIQRRLQEFNLWDESRFHTFQMRQRFQLGPFECVDCPCSLLLAPGHMSFVSLFCSRACYAMAVLSSSRVVAVDA